MGCLRRSHAHWSHTPRWNINVVLRSAGPVTSRRRATSLAGVELPSVVAACHYCQAATPCHPAIKALPCHHHHHHHQAEARVSRPNPPRTPHSSSKGLGNRAARRGAGPKQRHLSSRAAGLVSWETLASCLYLHLKIH